MQRHPKTKKRPLCSELGICGIDPISGFGNPLMVGQIASRRNDRSQDDPAAEENVKDSMNRIADETKSTISFLNLSRIK